MVNHGWLYYFPGIGQYLVLEISSIDAERAGRKTSEIKLWSDGRNEMIITENKIRLNSGGDRSLNANDLVSCLATTIGIDVDFNGYLNAISSIGCSAFKTFATIQTGLHCLSMAGVGMNNISSTAGCIIGIARIVACGVANCAGLSSQIGNVNTSGGGHPNRSNGKYNFCTPDFPCLEGQGDCDNDGECQAELACVHNVGSNYGWFYFTDVCEINLEPRSP